MSDGFGLILPPTPGLPWVAGNYYDYNAFRAASAAAGVALSANVMYTTLLDVPRGGARIDRISLNVTATGTATAGRLGIYLIGSNGKPGDLIVDGGEIDLTGTGDKELTIDTSLLAGPVLPVYFANGTCTVLVYGTPTTSPFGYASVSTTTKSASWSRSLAYTSLPATFGTPSGGGTTGGPAIRLRAA